MLFALTRGGEIREAGSAGTALHAATGKNDIIRSYMAPESWGIGMMPSPSRSRGLFEWLEYTHIRRWDNTDLDLRASHSRAGDTAVAEKAIDRKNSLNDYLSGAGNRARAGGGRTFARASRFILGYPQRIIRGRYSERPWPPHGIMWPDHMQERLQREDTR